MNVLECVSMSIHVNERVCVRMCASAQKCINVC